MHVNLSVCNVHCVCMCGFVNRDHISTSTLRIPGHLSRNVEVLMSRDSQRS